MAGPSRKVRAALDIFLTEGVRADGGTSTLHAAMGDARSAMDKGGALWLGTLGYLIVLEAMGGTVARVAAASRPRDTPSERFVTGAREFAPHPVSRDEAYALYGLRSALAHSFNLRNYKGRTHFYRFTLDQEGPLIDLAVPPWNGRTRPSPVNDMRERKRFTTSVNVREVGKYTEAVVENLRAVDAHGGVTLAHNVDADDVIAFGQFYVD